MPKRRNENVQQSKISDTRDRERNSIMAGSSHVAHDSDDGGRGQRFRLTKTPTGQHIVRTQEQPPYRYELDVPCTDSVDEKVYVIDDGTHSTMLLASEY